MIIHSHRGLGYGEDENTLVAFQVALERGHGVEVDVRLRDDGEIVIKHDALLPRESRPTFVELARLLRPFFPLRQDTVAIHLKAAEQTKVMVEKLAYLIAEFELQDSAFIFDVLRRTVDQFHSIDPAIRLAISLGAEHHAETIYTASDLTSFTDVPIIWWDEWGQAAGRLYTRENARRLKEKGYKVYVVSPDVAIQTGHPLAQDHKYVSVWRDLLTWRVDGICTDVPVELMSIPVPARNYVSGKGEKELGG